MFIKKHRTLLGLFISFIIIFLVCSLVSYRAEAENKITAVFDAEDFALNEKSGYEIITDASGKITYKATDPDPWTSIAFPEKIRADWVIISFDGAVNPDIDIVFYYSPDGSAFDSVHAYAHANMLSADKYTAIIATSEMECKSIRLDMDSEFSIKEIQFYDTEVISAATYKINVAVLVLLIIVFAALILLERKIGYFNWIYKLVLADVAYFRELYAARKMKSIIMHALMRLINVIFIFSVCFVFWTSVMTTAKIIYMIVISSLTLILNLAEKISTGSFATPERMFLITALIIGIMMVICLPLTTLNVPDEEIHYENSLNLKVALFGGEKSLSDMQMIWRYIHHLDYIKDPEVYVNNVISNDAILFKFDNSPINLYNSIGYLPIAIMMELGDLLSLSYTQTFFFAKLANVFVYAFVIALGIKRMKSGGYIVSTICLFPSAMILASGMTYDSWVMAFTTFGITYFISELQMQDKKLTVKDIVIMLGSMLIGCGPKAIYFVLMLPMLFMSKTKFETNKQKWYYRLACVATMGVILLSFALPFLVDTGGAADYRGGSDVNSAEQLKFILTNPLKYADIVFRFISDFLSFENMSNNITTHTYLGTPLTIYATILIFILMFVAFTDKAEEDMFADRHIIKSMGILGCVGAMMLVVTALYIAFTPVAHETVNGVQFRYVFPIMPLFFYCLGPSRIHSKIDRRVTQFMVYGITSLVTILCVYEFYITKLIA